MAIKKKLGRPKKPIESFVEKPKYEKAHEANPFRDESSSGPKCVECGSPVAPGQTYVCVSHQRAG